VLSITEGMVEHALRALTTAAAAWDPEQRTAENLAKRVASRMYGRTPLIVGPEYLGVVARRWANQINENSKQWAFHSELPEADHNLIAGLRAPASAVRSMQVVLLTSSTLDRRNQLRVQLTAQQFREAGITCDELSVDGGDALSVSLRAAFLGDWVSLYLAMLNGVDPTPVDPLEGMKRAMQVRGPGAQIRRAGWISQYRVAG
jgi:glucose/mannose-6-phosphate isomerase